MLHDLLVSLYDSPLGTAIRETSAFPWIESVHVLAIVTVVGTIAIVDLRLLGVAAHHRGIRRLMSDLVPLTWGAFGLALLTGLLLFSSHAPGYAANRPFQTKLILLVFAGLNMLIFHFRTGNTIQSWDEAPRPPLAAKLAGSTSLLLWASIVFLGRWIGFTNY